MFRQPAVGHALRKCRTVGTSPVAVVFGCPLAHDVPRLRDEAVGTSHVDGAERLEHPVSVRFLLPELELILTDPPAQPCVQSLEQVVAGGEAEVPHPSSGVQVQFP